MSAPWCEEHMVVLESVRRGSKLLAIVSRRDQACTKGETDCDSAKSKGELIDAAQQEEYSGSDGGGGAAAAAAAAGGEVEQWECKAGEGRMMRL